MNPRELSDCALSSTDHTVRLADSVFDGCVYTCLLWVNSTLILEISIGVPVSVDFVKWLWHPGSTWLNWPLSDKRIINCINKNNTIAVRQLCGGSFPVISYLFPGRHSVAAVNPSRSHSLLASASSSFVPSVFFQHVSGKSKTDSLYAV